MLRVEVGVRRGCSKSGWGEDEGNPSSQTAVLVCHSRARRRVTATPGVNGGALEQAPGIDPSISI